MLCAYTINLKLFPFHVYSCSCRFISDESVKASKTSAEASARSHVAQVAGQSILYELTAKALNGKAKHKTVMKSKALSEHYHLAVYLLALRVLRWLKIVFLGWIGFLGL